ncbi:MAG TPA: 2Fe-2S iron-sulfur cluster-binding protein [Euzebyales bacterium]
MTVAATLEILRCSPGGADRRLERFDVTVHDGATVLDAIEAVWAHHDRTLTFRHACHHASCGSCGVRVNGVEVLPCVTDLDDAMRERTPVRVEPLRNLPLAGDLVVDVAAFFERMQASDMTITRTAEDGLPTPAQREVLDTAAVEVADGLTRFNRFENCIECGICISACPTMATDDRFRGPAMLAALGRAQEESSDPGQRDHLLDLADGEHGVWRCHGAWECTARCPQQVDPAESIMQQRRDLLRRRLRRRGR